MGSGDEAVVGTTREPESSMQLREVTTEQKGEVGLTSFLPGLVLPPWPSILSAK